MKIRKVKLFCLDDHRNFSEEIRNKFGDDSKYLVYSTTNREEFVRLLSKESVHASVIIPVVALHNNRDQIETISQIFREPGMSRFKDSVIILVPVENFDEISTETSINAYAYIPRNTNFTLRLDNAIKKMISEHNLAERRRIRNIYLYILIAITLITLVFVLTRI